MKKLVTAIILVFMSMASMADENKVNETILLDTSIMNAKLEQILQDRLNSELSRENVDTLNDMSARGKENILLHTMDYFKVDTNLPE